MWCEKLQNNNKYEEMKKAFEEDETYKFKMWYSKQINNIITPKNNKINS